MDKNEHPTPSQVIIIDDDHLVRDFAVHTIEYGVNRKVIEFDSGFNALKFIRNNPKEVDVVIADVNIPDLDGFELLTEFKQIHPNKAFIITTSNPRHEETACRLGADAFVLKPFDIQELFVVVRQFVLGNDKSEAKEATPASFYNQ